MPYRVDLRTAGADALDRLIDLGALDVEPLPGVAAVMPDRVALRRVGRHGRLVLTGIPDSVVPDADQACRRLGLRLIAMDSGPSRL